uniref:Membrane-bound metal-dependent hydrolase n=1 Tax=uncultured bacterium Contig1772 TaxID=1393512 RepID=W0FNU0_9BACT|nr:membrane-bound metal-dependent hydrolase [uncultured bacterium Contig1772]
MAAVVGGSVGGIIADCDIAPSRAHKDALVGRLIVVAVAAVALLADRYANAGLCDYLVEHLGATLVIGIVLFAALTFAGSHTEHRTFTHSLLAMACFSAAVYLVCEPLVPYFAVGYASHLVLDITNKQGVRLIWPLEAKASLGLCTAKGIANTVVMALGYVAVAVLLAYRLAPLVPMVATT